MKRSTLAWSAVALALLVAGGTALRARGDGAAQAAAAAKSKTPTLVELATTDVVTAQATELTLGQAITGSLRAVNSAVVKARVAGELQALVLREGDSVRAGQEIARIDPVDAQARLQQAQEQADAAAAQVQIAQRQFDNNRALVDQGFISRTALEGSQSTLAGAQATHRAALAAVASARKTLDDTVLRAPIAGVVSQRLAQPGERLAVDARVLEIVDTRELELEASLAAADSVPLRAGQKATLTVEGLAQPVAATVVRINPAAQVSSRSVAVYLSVQPVPGLRQGLFAQGVVATGRAGGVAVPLSALRTDKPQPYVQVVENDQVAHKPVTPGTRGEGQGPLAGQTLVTVQGLAAGAQVILGHAGVLREGTAVRFTRPAP